jgi:hypothetical protein
MSETTEITGDIPYSQGKINTLLYDLYSVQCPHFSCGLSVSVRIDGENVAVFAAHFKIEVLAIVLKANTI